VQKKVKGVIQILLIVRICILSRLKKRLQQREEIMMKVRVKLLLALICGNIMYTRGR
jgi:hypothetical protein